MRIRWLCAALGMFVLMAADVASGQGRAGRVGTPPPPAPSPAPGSNCVSIAAPQPSRIYTYQHRESTGALTSTTNQWESVTTTGSRVRITGPQGVQIHINTHTILGDVAILTLTRKTDGKGGLMSSTEFSPGLVSDPAFRACTGKSWGIGAVAATYRTASGQGGSAMTPGGTLTILGIREQVTVPAGTFDTVHYLRSTSQANDEYWKSTEHGVVVKHIATLRGGAGGVTETLLSIR